MMKTKSNILVYDKDNVFLSGLIYILKEMPEIAYVTGFSVENDAKKALLQQDFDLFIVEVDGIDPGGISLISEIHSNYKNCRILVNTVCEADLIWGILKHTRINGLLHKKVDIQEMEQAVRHLLTDDCYCSPDYNRLNAIFPREPIHNFCSQELLTSRERDILHLIAQGHSSAVIAEKLDISENTVESFRKKLIQKFDARNSVDLVVKAMKSGCLELDYTT